MKYSCSTTAVVIGSTRYPPRAVAALANGLGMATTAEGVETREQWDTVKSEGCTEMQGYLFSKAIPAHEIEPLLVKTKNGKGVRSAEAA